MKFPKQWSHHNCQLLCFDHETIPLLISPLTVVVYPDCLLHSSKDSNVVINCLDDEHGS